MASSKPVKIKPIVMPDELPSTVDWRDMIKLRVQNQGKCTALRECFATLWVDVAKLAVWQIKNMDKPFKRLSSQMLLDCVAPDTKDQDRNRCYSLSAVKAFEWLMKNEVYGETGYPYKGKRGTCQLSSDFGSRCEQINGALREKIIRQVHQHPVAAVVDVYSEFILLKEGIYEGPKEYQDDIPTHVVVIVGYGTQGIGPNAKNYWIVISTWGRGWGVKGFGKVVGDAKQFAHVLAFAEFLTLHLLVQ
ncbi:hypothetical protein COLO4_26598 [Corchorus olitorius]|uniref:Peptidase C1A papain C-terminal domain-containing protein n=1 Tax=Corchorus olitorius TaxID=93759 RepID=A0A1R3HW98_9ROSI|nr:hypothetical protein COLO4_26598 [Corchorus olitorius]